MFDTLTLRAGSDPASRHFNGLARVAGQLLGGDPQWIRRLMASGQWEAAQTAATEHESSEPEMKQILFDLAAETEDSFYLWEIAFRLAESHRTVLPQAAALGQVELLNAAKDADVFLISDDEASRRPRIAIVYPKAVGGLFTEARAWKWIDRLAPPTLRGEMSYRSLDGRSAPFANGVDVYFFGDGKRGPWHHIEVLANGIYETWDLRAAGLTP